MTQLMGERPHLSWPHYTGTYGMVIGRKRICLTHHWPETKLSRRRIHKCICRIATTVFSLAFSTSLYPYYLLLSPYLSLYNHTNVKTWMFGDKEVKNKKQSPTKRFGFWWISLRHQQISENSIGDGWEGVSVFSKDMSCTAWMRWWLCCKS